MCRWTESVPLSKREAFFQTMKKACVPEPPQQFWMALRLVPQFRAAPVQLLPGGQDVRRRGPARIAADHPRSHVAPGELVGVRLASRLEPGNIGDLALDQLVPQHPFHVAPVLGMAVVGQRHGQAEKVHQGAGFAGDDIALAPDDLGQEAEAGALGADVAVEGIDPAEKHGVFHVQGIVGGSHQGSQVAMHVAAVAERVVGSEQRVLVEAALHELPGLLQGGFGARLPHPGHQALDDEPRSQWSGS